MSIRQFAITVFPLIMFVLTTRVVFADEPAGVVSPAELDELPPVPSFTVPQATKDDAQTQNENAADDPADVNPEEELDELPPVPTYNAQSKPKDEVKNQGEKTADETADKKRERLIKEAESGSAEAAMELANEAENNNIKEAVEHWLKVAAEAGSAEAWFRLGLKAIEKDDDKTAFECFKKSADAGYEDANIYLAFGYMEGLGTKKDVEKGKALLQSVADSGSVTAIRKLALACRFGIGFEKDEQKSLELLTQLYQNAKEVSTRVMAAADLLEMNGKGGLKQADELLDNLDLSALQTPESKEKSLFLLSNSLLERSSRNTDNDNSVSQKRFSRLMDILLDAGNLIIDEGTFYAVMKVCEDNAIVPDSEKTRLFQAMEQLANLDNPVAMLCLAYLYVKGIGTEKDRYMFEYWLDKSARNGYAPAQYYAFLFLSDDAPVISKRRTDFLKLACEAQFPNARYLQLIGCLRCHADSSDDIEKIKIALVESEGVIEQYLKDREENNHEEKDVSNAALPVSNEYLKWGRGRMSVDYSKIRSKRIKRSNGVDVFNPENMVSDLWQYDYYINISDLIYSVACCYKQETAGCSFDAAKVQELLLLAMECGNECARNVLIEDYWMADEDEKAFQELQKAMDDNAPWAYLKKFKYACYNPDGTENFEQAIPYLRKAVELNAGRANKYLGMCYILGKGVQQDIEKGVKILEDNKEYLMLMLLYGKGLGVEQDAEKSKRYFAMELAKDDGVIVRSKYIIGEINETDFCIRWYNYEEALICTEYYLYFNKYYLRRMEKEGVSHAATFWGLYQTDCKTTRTLLRKAAQQGDSFDIAIAGCVALTKCSDRQLNQDGREFLLKAAQSGQTMAMVILGSQSIKDGMKEDDQVKKMKLLEEGKQWLKQAADKGNLLCYLITTQMLIDSGMQVDLEEYHRYLDWAVELNYTHAMILKATFLIRNFKPEKNDDVRQKIDKLLQQAADLGSLIANDMVQQLNHYYNQKTDEYNAKFWRIPYKNSDFSMEKYNGWNPDKQDRDSGLPSLPDFNLPKTNNNNDNFNIPIPQLKFNMGN